MNPMLRATLQEARITLASSMSLKIYSVVATIQAAAFLVFAPSFLAVFALIVFGLLPMAFLVLAAASVSSDRETGFANLLMAGPMSRTAYLGSRFLHFFLLGLVALSLSVPYLGVLVVTAGWSLELVLLLVLGALVSLFLAVSLGLAISVLGGGRGTGVTLGFGFAVVLTLVITPFISALPPFYQAEPFVAGALYRATHLSPIMTLADMLALQGAWVSGQWALSWFLTVILGAVLLVATWLILTRFQNVEDWDCRAGVRVSSMLAVLILPVAASAFLFPPGIAVDPNQQSFSEEAGAIFVALEFESLPPWTPGQRVAGVLNVTVIAFNVQVAAFHNIRVDLDSFLIRFNRSTFHLGDMSAASSPGSRMTTRLEPVEAVVAGSAGITAHYAGVRMVFGSEELTFQRASVYPLSLETPPPLALVLAIWLVELAAVQGLRVLRRNHEHH